MNWFGYAILSAVFAALTSIFAKIGIKDVGSNLATAIRTVVILLVAWGIVIATGEHKGMTTLPKNTLVFLILSGIATGLSWVFYFKALQIGQASKVVPIDKLSLVLTIVLAVVILKEKINLMTILGAAFITGGTLLIALAK
ncbi:EamA family transporter [candidate division WWE3 bacterium]|uniref:EamA family transporter n=1 Tax=candidate division WWE3 bacterium TaxID=2053526 RepID=A0A7X9HHI9_UNCKA|nr:EamA family transporter [candidate division WWE3 bacterium]